MRPSFKSGIDKYKNDVKPKTLSPPQKLQTADIPTRPAFSTPQHIARKIDSFERLRQLQVQREGVKVQLGPSTTAFAGKLLSKVIGVEIPDPNNPNVNIKKDVSIAELLKTQTGLIQGLAQLIAMYMMGRQGQQQQAPGGIGGIGGIPQSQSAQEQEQLIAVFGLRLLETKLKSGEDFTKREAELIARASSLVIKSDNPSTVGLPQYVSEKDIFGINGAKIYAYLLKPKTGQPGLSPFEPIYELDGYTPLNINRIPEYLRRNRGSVIDMLNNAVVRERQAPRAPTNQGTRIKQDLSSRTVDELRQMAEQDYGINLPQRYIRKAELINKIMDEIQNIGIQHSLPPSFSSEEEEKSQPAFTFSERGRPQFSVPRFVPFRPFQIDPDVEQSLRERGRQQQRPRQLEITEGELVFPAGTQHLQQTPPPVVNPNDPQSVFDALQQQQSQQQQSIYERQQSGHFW